MQDYDLVVIGSGSGLDVANAVAQHGKRVAIIEKDRMGGTCLNRGCIPSKLLIHSADVAETIRTAGAFGIKVDGFSVDFEFIVSRSNRIVDTDSDGIMNAFAEIDNPKLYHGECKFAGEKILKVNGQTIKGQKILIASGTRPKIPQIPGLAASGYITSDEALRLKVQPKVLTILGGGYIAAELAHFFGALGTKVNIIQRRDVLVPSEDDEVSSKFTEIISRKYRCYLGHATESVSKKGGKFRVMAKNSSGKLAEIESDQLLVAVGRTPNSDTLDLAATGVETDPKGFVKVDQFLETTAKGIFALGDAVGRYLFKHAANHEAQYAYNNIIHDKGKSPVDYTAMPHAVFASPQIAGVGHTEQELKKNGIQYEKAVYPYIKTAMGEAIEDKEGFVKFLATKQGKILGCHIIGSHASILIHEVLIAMKLGAGMDQIARTIHIHPALSEVVSRAASSL
ncbi:MAG TPA: dihydrolipoyl dehydrogenase [Nitrososphaera sp.]|nr:dihydrolipoyl dehydrogenase [Nitrososphaera sp.]